MKTKIRKVTGPAAKSTVTSPKASGYSDAGASIIKRALKAFTPNSGSPIEDIDWNNSTLRQRCRTLYMSAPVATSAIKTSRTKAIGVGLKLQAAPDRDVLGLSPEAAKDWMRNVEREFSLWADKKDNCDATGLNNFSGMQQLAFMSWFLSGDCFAVIQRYDVTPFNPYSLRLHLIEADRCITPPMNSNGIYGSTEGRIGESGNKIHDGVEVNATGRIVAYHFCNQYPQRYVVMDERQWQRVSAYGEKTGLPNVLHITASERADQYRGVPFLAQVVEPLLQLRRYTESELMAALVQSFFTAFIKTSADPSQLPFGSTGVGNTMGIPSGNPVPDEHSGSDVDYELGPGTVNVLEEGEDVVFGNPNIPTAGFDAFVKAICKEIGSALEIPYDVLLKEFNASYSASRAALLEMWEAVKMWRSWFVDDFCQPAYEIWLAEAVARGRIRAPGFFDDPLKRKAWCGANWIGPVAGSLDPKKEAEAAVILIDHGIKTHEQTTREMTSGNWEENVEQLARETELLAAAVPAPASPLTGTGGNDDDDDEL